MEDSLDPEISLCPRCGAMALPGRTSCHMCYAPLSPMTPACEKQQSVNRNASCPDDTYQIGDVSSVALPQITSDDPASQLTDNEATLSDHDDEPAVPPSATLICQPVSLPIPDFLNPRTIRKYARRCRMSRWFAVIRMTVLSLLIASAFGVPYVMYRQYLQKIPSPVQQMHQSAMTYASAINKRDYEWVYDHTLWRSHFGRLFTNANDIKHFCHHPDRFNSQKLRYLAEIWQMKHTVVSGGTQIGRNSIACHFNEFAVRRRMYTLTFTKDSDGQWLWDICYDIRLTPTDIPLLNNIIAKSRLQTNR